MKRIKHLLTTLLLIFCLSAFAEKVTINGIRYEIVTKGKAAIVIKSEAGDGGYSGNIIIPETVKYNGTTHNVADIGGSAFSKCSELKRMEIPNRVTNIYSYRPFKRFCSHR